MPEDKAIFRISYVILLFLFLIRLLPAVFPETRTWGFNHLIFLPGTFTYLYIIMACTALIIPFTGLAAPLAEKTFNRFTYIFYESPKRLVFRSLFTLAMTALFVFYAMPTHFLGDGYTVIDILAHTSGTIHKWSEAGTTIILGVIQSILGGKSELTAQSAFQIVSVLSGLISVWFFFLIAGQISEKKEKRILVFVVSVCSGALLLFFGYVENYPMLWIALSGFVYFGLKRLNTGSGLLPAFLFLAGGISLHLQTAILVPAFIYLLIARGNGLKFYGRFKPTFWIIIAVLLVGLTYLFISKYNTDLYFRNIFLPLFYGKPIYPAYTLLSSPHLIDIANQLMLLSPLVLLLLFLSAANVNNLLNDKRNTFLGFISLVGLIFLLVVDPKLGMARDWDLFALTGYPVTLLMVRLIPARHLLTLKKLLLSAIILAVAASLPFLITNLSVAPSLEYQKYIINLDREKSLPSWVALRDYYRSRGDTKRVDSLKSFFNAYYPNESRMEMAFRALDRKDTEMAKTLLKGIRADKFSSNYHNLLSGFYLQLGRFQQALEESKKAIQLRAYDPRLYYNQAMIYSRLGQNRNAYKALIAGYRLDSGNVFILEGLSHLFLETNNIDSVLYYAGKLIATDSGSALGHYLLAVSYINQNSPDSAQYFLKRYIEYGRSDPLYSARLSALKEKIERLEGDSQ